jgi:hypothetical protein
MRGGPHLDIEICERPTAFFATYSLAVASRAMCSIFGYGRAERVGGRSQSDGADARRYVRRRVASDDLQASLVEPVDPLLERVRAAALVEPVRASAAPVSSLVVIACTTGSSVGFAFARFRLATCVS